MNSELERHRPYLRWEKGGHKLDGISPQSTGMASHASASEGLLQLRGTVNHSLKARFPLSCLPGLGLLNPSFRSATRLSSRTSRSSYFLRLTLRNPSTKPRGCSWAVICQGQAQLREPRSGSGKPSAQPRGSREQLGRGPLPRRSSAGSPQKPLCSVARGGAGITSRSCTCPMHRGRFYSQILRPRFSKPPGELSSPG